MYIRGISLTIINKHYGSKEIIKGKPRKQKRNLLRDRTNRSISLHIPCFRVVNAKGEIAGAIAKGGESVQAQLLEADGIEVIDGIVDLKKYGILQKIISKRTQRAV